MGRGHRTFRRRRRNFLLSRLAAATLLFLACLIIYFHLPQWKEQREVSVARGQVSAFVTLPSLSSEFSADLAYHRVSLPPTYPYSVIPGGVRTVAELRRAIARDPLIKAHYHGFNLAKARVIRLKESREVYVSYRRGSAIFWTSRKLILHKGEILITDGTSLSRTRCGNRTSYTPSLPRSPVEPTPEALNTPIPPIFPSSPPAPSPDGSIFIPPVIPIPTGGDPSPPIPPGPPGPVGTPPTPVSEPGALYLLLVALPLAWFVRRISSR